MPDKNKNWKNNKNSNKYVKGGYSKYQKQNRTSEKPQYKKAPNKKDNSSNNYKKDQNNKFKPKPVLNNAPRNADQPIKSFSKSTPSTISRSKLQKGDYVIPDAHFYQILVILMIFFNLLGLGVLIYNQYNGQLIERPVILTQIGGESSYQSCLNYCERYATSDDLVKDPVNQYVNEENNFQVSLGQEFIVSKNTEINALDFEVPGTECGTVIRMIFVDPKGASLDQWIVNNYADFDKQLMNDRILDSVSYKVFTRSEVMSDKNFFELDDQIIELSYEYTKGTGCSYNNDEILVEQFVDSLRKNN